MTYTFISDIKLNFLFLNNLLMNAIWDRRREYCAMLTNKRPVIVYVTMLVAFASSPASFFFAFVTSKAKKKKRRKLSYSTPSDQSDSRF